MSEKLTIYYSVENGGDGSAYPMWFDTEKLSEWHQEHLDEEWGEPCTGSIVVTGDNLRYLVTHHRVDIKSFSLNQVD